MERPTMQRQSNLSPMHTPTALMPVDIPARLFPDLKLALASLYSLPVLASQQHNQGHQLPPPQQTHEFLMYVQSRNVRRKIRSLQQQYRDQQIGKMNNDIDLATKVTETIQMGSSWLACLALVCQRVCRHHQHDRTESIFMATTTERLFAAQTLLHRLRRVRMSEAVDIELEAWEDTNDKAWILQSYQSNAHTEHLVTNYQSWMKQSCHNHLVALVLHNASIHDALQTTDEDEIKAKLTILTLACVMYMQACDRTIPDHERMPLLTTTASALVTAIFRLRYDKPGHDSCQEEQAGPALVTLVHQSFQMVWQTVCTADRCTQTFPIQIEAWTIALLTCFAILPDSILGSPGGARGRLSVDPRSLCAASQDLRRVDTPLLVEIIVATTSTSQQQTNAQLIMTNDITQNLWILQTCAKWAAFLPLTMPLLQLTLPLVNQCLSQYPNDSHAQTVAFSFLIALYESGSWSVEQIVSSSMGMADHQMIQQQTKKKQSTRAKKRQKERIENNSTETTLKEARAEKELRGEIACQATLQCWPAIGTIVQACLTEASSKTRYQVQGEGPIGCLAACANACLPHMLRQHSNNNCAGELFRSIASAFQQLCTSSQKSVRALALEPLYTLHSALLEVLEMSGNLDIEMQSIVVDHFFTCSINIAFVCSYPLQYFDHLEAESDHDLEIERNDVRDLLRTVSGSGEGGSTIDSGSDQFPMLTTTHILAKIVEACRTAIVPSQQHPSAFPETAAHALSSLAKPVNHLSKCYAASTGENHDRTLVRNILESVLHVLLTVNRIVVAAFHHQLPLKQLLPLSRIANIGNASFAPFFSALISIQDESISCGVSQMLDIAIQGSILSLEQIPELCAPSILDHSQYDIRGTMRGPGGEDHVGCLTLMRLALDSEGLSQRMVSACTPYMTRLCSLYQTLKRVEFERSDSVFHGRGVCAQTRRIFVGVLCHLDHVAQGHSGASELLSSLFNTAIASIGSLKSQTEFDFHEMFKMNEITLDLASFSTFIVATLFESIDDYPAAVANERTDCLEVLTNAVTHGYKIWAVSDTADPRIVQWNRLRTALFLLLRKASTAGKDISERGAAMVRACVVAECEAIHQQCTLGPESRSVLFADGLICTEDGVPAGLFVRCIVEVLQSCRNQKDVCCRHCVQTLHAVKDYVISSMLLPCPTPRDGAFLDPRPTVSETWFQAMIELAESKTFDEKIQTLLVDTSVAIVSLLFMPLMGRAQIERMKDCGMSLDGPHSLALTAFLVTLFRRGIPTLQIIGQKLLRMTPVDNTSITLTCQDPNFHGVAVIGAALFRACQGALPPWAVESIPEVYQSFFEACGSDVEAFAILMRLSMDIRLLSSVDYGGIRRGNLLSGRYFENLSEKARSNFIADIKELSAKGGITSWRRMKSLIKQACGGKKRDTEFNQKPSATRWEFERV